MTNKIVIADEGCGRYPLVYERNAQLTGCHLTHRLQNILRRLSSLPLGDYR